MSKAKRAEKRTEKRNKAKRAEKRPERHDGRSWDDYPGDIVTRQPDGSFHP